jgi:hypothetical protein
MPTGQIVSTISVGGVEFASNISRTAVGQVSHVTAVPAGIAGVQGTLTITGLAVGHGLVTSDVVDIHFTDPTDGVTHKVRRGITVDSSTSTTITYDETPAGIGDATAANGTAVVVSKRVTIDTDWDGDLLEMIALKSTGRAIADFWTSSATLYAQKLATEQAFSWINGQGVANPLTGSPVDVVKVSNGTVAAVTFTLGVLYRSA